MRGIMFSDANDTTFSRHTADDWGLVMVKKIIGTPALKGKTVELDDRDGVLDFTTALRGVPSYEARELRFDFEYLDAPEDWTKLFTEIRGFLHGRRVKIQEPDDDEYYYLGRAQVEDPEGELVKSFTVTVIADTWKYKNGNPTTITRTVSAGTTISLVNDWRPISPSITTNGTVSFSFKNTIYSISGAGSFRFPTLILTYGVNTIEVLSGSGEITFTYQEGAI